MMHEDGYVPDYPTSFRLLYPLILGVARGLLRDRGRAEKIAQDVLLQGYRKHRTFRERRWSDYRSYLWKLCKERCARELRGGAAPAEKLPPSLRGICLSSLDEEQWLVLSLYYGHGYRYDQIAEIVGRSPGWVFGRIRAIKALISRATPSQYR